MITNECIDAALKELSAVGITGTVRPSGKHAAIEWKRGDDDRTYHAALTPSDRRAHLNVRSDIRRMLRADGLLHDEDDMIAGDRPRLVLADGRFVCDSRDIAAHFSKQHKNVLQSIDKIMEELGEFGRLNFQPISYLDNSSRRQRAFCLTRDGFSILAMGFTGDAALAWKVKYIDAFNAMETELRRVSPASLPSDVEARLGKLEGDLNALIDLSLSQPMPEPGFIIVKSYKRRARRAAA
jgi:Rha family phage regulatory protein